ncbi:MAG: (Fe-S)-binding protein [Anaerolineales bacterium]|nr:(Fe-S)-binding protein [Anaerolineales bacterium]
MLSLVERLAFALLTLASAAAALRAADRIRRVIRRGRGPVSLAHLGRRLARAGVQAGAFLPTWRARLGPSLLHAFVGWAFIFYLLVNLGDVLQALLPGFVFLGPGVVGQPYRLLADVLSVLALVGMAALLLRRFVLRAPAFRFNPRTTLHPRVQGGGIRRDSAIVGGFILVHVGARFLGDSVALALAGPDPWRPFASLTSRLWLPLPPAALTVLAHVFFWGALGSILLFVPYFLHSKHLHLFLAPLNFLLRPERRSLGQLTAINFDDESITQYGAARLEELEWKLVQDAYACIMCNRCQDACPAHVTGKALSPAALEINKRYFVNQHGAALAAGQPSPQGLLEFAIGPEEVWACTTCGACVDICPVGNEPMRDLLDLRRNLVLMESSFPDQLQTAYKGMERLGNPWNVSPDSRLEWAEGLAVPTVAQNPAFEILYWVGCAPATDPRARQTARALVRVLSAAGVNFAVLGQQERCTGDAARRSGNEFLFSQLATQNVATLNAALGDPTTTDGAATTSTAAPKRRIVTTCPHCLHTLQNEYGDFGGHYQVVHHTSLIAELQAAGKLKTDLARAANLTFHDPCYLGRHNNVLEAPRAALRGAGAAVTELPRHGRQSFCCGAGGAQMWKEEEPGEQRVSANRFAEAAASGADTLAVACPFCLIMLSDAATAAKSTMPVRDVAELVAEALAPQSREAGG